MKWVTPRIAPHRLDHTCVDSAAGRLKRAREGEDVLWRTQRVEQFRLEHALRVAFGASEVVGERWQPADDKHHCQARPLRPGYARQEKAQRKLTAARRIAEYLRLVVAEQNSGAAGSCGPFACEFESLEQLVLEHGRLAGRVRRRLYGKRDPFERYGQAAEQIERATCGCSGSLSEREGSRRMLNGASAVLNQRERECGLVLEVLATFAADNDPATRLGRRCVVLQKHRLSDASQAGQPDVAWKGREPGQILVEAVQLSGAVREIRRVQPHPWAEWIRRLGMILFWLDHFGSFPRLDRKSVTSVFRQTRSSSTAVRSSAETVGLRLRSARTSCRQTSARTWSCSSKVSGSGVSGSPASAPSTSSSRSASRRSTTRWTCRWVSSGARSISSARRSLSARREICTACSCDRERTRSNSSGSNRRTPTFALRCDSEIPSARSLSRQGESGPAIGLPGALLTVWVVCRTSSCSATAMSRIVLSSRMQCASSTRSRSARRRFSSYCFSSRSR